MKTRFLQRMMGCWVVGAAAVVVVPGISFGEGEADAAASAKANEFAPKIASARTMAGNLKAEYDQMAGELQGLPGETAFFTDDLVKAKKHYDELEGKYESAADSWAQGDDAGAQKIFAEAQGALGTKDVWRQRLNEYRRGQANIAPTDQWYQEMSANTRPGAIPVLNKWVAAKKAAADAWGEVAEATVPGADPKAINELKEKAFVAGGEVEIATWRFYWANQLDSAWGDDKSVSPDDVKEQLAELQRTQDDLVALRREQIAHERKVREASAEMSKAQDQLFRDIWGARAAKANAAAAAATTMPAAQDAAPTPQ